MGRIRFVLIAVIGAGLLFGVASPDAQTSAEAALKAAIELETVHGNVAAAMEAYKKLASDPNRAVAAEALLHLGSLQERSGQREATETYSRIVKEFPQQTDAVAQARARLDALARPAPGSGPTESSVWTPPGDIGRGVSSVSSDGRYLAFVDSNSQEVFVRDLRTGQNRQLTSLARVRRDPSQSEKDSYFAVGPCVFSKDGTRLATIWWNGAAVRHEIVVVDVAGTAPPLRLPAGGTPQDWTSDGQWLLGHERAAAPNDVSRRIALISLTGAPMRLLAAELSWTGAQGMKLSPDDKFVAFDRAEPNRSTGDVFVIPVDGGPEVRVVNWQADDRLLDWSPDGRQILFLSDRAGTFGIWAVDFLGDRAGEPQPVKLDTGTFEPLGLTQNGSLYYVRRSSRPLAELRIEPIDLATGRQDQLQPVTLSHATFNSIAWSPDGTELSYFVSMPREGRNLVIAVHTVTTGQVRYLRPPLVDSQLTMMRWSPDGRWLALRSVDPDGRAGLYRIDARTAETVLITDREPITSLAWSSDSKTVHFSWNLRGGGKFGFSAKHIETDVEQDLLTAATRMRTGLSPDGRVLYYSRATERQGEEEIVSRDLTTGTDRVLLPAGRYGPAGPLLISPNGRLLVVERRGDSSTPNALYVVSQSGEPPREIAQNATFLEWSPDSTAVLVRRLAGETSRSAGDWWIPLDDRSAQQLVPGLGPFRLLSASPNGKHIAILNAQNAAQQQPEIRVLENFLKRR